MSGELNENSDAVVKDISGSELSTWPCSHRHYTSLIVQWTHI